jgi:sorbitol/mannitol transport system substrate-binding protein
MKKLMVLFFAVILSVSLFAVGGQDSKSRAGTELVIASVNNPSMQIMQELSAKYTEQTGVRISWTMLPENELRTKITQDVAMGGGQYDLITLGSSDGAVYLDNGWTVALQPYFDKMDAARRNAYDLDDIFQAAKLVFSSPTRGLGGLPFYAESSMIYYRKDIFSQKGLTMPANPTWQDIYRLAVACHDPRNNFYGIALRGLPGYGENMYPFGVIMYSFGGQYFDKNWNATWNTPAVRNALEFYKKLQDDAGQPSPTTAGYTECLNLMANGRAAIYYDATVSASTFAAASDSQVKGKLGYALSPTAVKTSNTMPISGWGLCITSGSKNKDAAFDFLVWATSRDYIALVGETKGWPNVPSGTRKSTYSNPRYTSSVDFADLTFQSINRASFDHPAINETPYSGNSLANMPEYSSYGEQIGQLVAAYLAGSKTVDQVLQEGQKILEDVVIEGGYKK